MRHTVELSYLLGVLVAVRPFEGVEGEGGLGVVREGILRLGLGSDGGISSVELLILLLLLLLLGLFLLLLLLLGSGGDLGGDLLELVL